MSFSAPADLPALAALVWAWALQFLPRLGGAIAILVLGFLLAHHVARGAIGLLDRTGRLDPTFHPVLRAVVRYAILIFVIIAALGQLGVQTTSVLAVLGAAGLAIGLALQGTLANIAAGIMLLWLRPFRVGDFIESSAVAGTVEELGLFNSRLRTWDGIYKFVPNSLLWNTIVTNYTRNPTRLVLIQFGIAYEAEIAAGRKALRDAAMANPRVLKDPPVQVVPLTLGDSSVVLELRAWARNPEFWEVRWELTEAGKTALEEAGITIPFPQRVVHIVTEGPPAEAQPPAAAGVISGPGMPAGEPAEKHPFRVRTGGEDRDRV